MRLRHLAAFALLIVFAALPAVAGLPPLHDFYEFQKAIRLGLVPAVDAECSSLDVLTYDADTNRWSCSSVAAATATAGAGLLNTAGTWSTDSTEASFVSSTSISCGSTNTHGKASVNGKALAYCDADTTNTKHYAAYGDANGNMLPTVQAQTVADSGNGSAATATLTITSNVVEVTCNDADGCAETLSESGAVDGFMVTIVNMSANSVTFSDSAGVSETGGSLTLGQYDVVRFLYASDRWVQISAVENN